MNYKKMWEQLKSSADNNLLEKMAAIEEATNAPKEENKIDFDPYKFIDNKDLLTEQLQNFSLDQLKVIAKQKHITLARFKNKNQMEFAKILAHTLYSSYHAGDCFRYCSRPEEEK